MEAPVNRLAQLLALAALIPGTPVFATTHVMVVAGLGGEPEYEQRFVAWSEGIAKASVTATGGTDTIYRLSGSGATREAIESRLKQLAGALKPGDEFVLVLLGHGSFDGSDYRFNIPGPDLTGSELSALLDKLPEAVPQLLVNATSTSGAVAEKWTRPNRVVVTATRNGGERNATRFGAYWAEALGSEEADLNKDGTITAKEAFDFATRRVADAFKTDASVATEHSRLVGDNADHFTVARLGAAALFASDAPLKALRAEQTAAEGRLAALRPLKAQIGEDAYYNRIEPVLIEMAKLGDRVDARLAALGSTGKGVDNKEGTRAKP
jgi:hypothetical protein